MIKGRYSTGVACLSSGSLYWNKVSKAKSKTVRGAMADRKQVPEKQSGAADPATMSTRNEIDAFLGRAQELAAAKQSSGGQRGRLLFALDATMSRQPTWDAACHHQAAMFHATDAIGGLDVQLIYFRGFNECRASRWVSSGASLADLMSRIDCRGGHTQIRKVLQHAIKETKRQKVDAVIYVGDCMEEHIDDLCALAGELGVRGVPVFAFQEGRVPVAETAFREIARLSGGAYCRFDEGSAEQLRQLLSAVAVYASGGRAALEDFSSRRGGEGQKLLAQLKS